MGIKKMQTRSQTAKIEGSKTQKSLMWRWEQDALDCVDRSTANGLQLTRTESFIKCMSCSHKNNKYHDKCDKCNTTLPHRPFLFF